MVRRKRPPQQQQAERQHGQQQQQCRSMLLQQGPLRFAPSCLLPQLVLVLSCLALLALAAEPVSGINLHMISHSRVHHCIVDVYTNKNQSLTEYRFLVTVLYAHISHHCGCRLMLKEREKAPDAIRGLADYKQPAMVLVAARDLRPEELAAMQAAGPHARAKLVVVHQSDEHNNFDISWYPTVKAVFRNYHRDRHHLVKLTQYLTMPRKAGGPLGAPSMARSFQRRDALGTQHAMAGSALDLETEGLMSSGSGPSDCSRQQHQQDSTSHRSRNTMSQLDMPGDLTKPAEDDQNVFWIPLGFGESFVASQAMQADLMSRPLLWSWTGSWGAKPERTAMVKVFNKQPELLMHGVLHSFEHFKGPEMLPPVRYSTLLYESKLVPLPPGIHPEQFRLYEAMAAGTIPIILKGHLNAGLAHVDVLNFKALWVDSWKDAPALMLELLTNKTMQQELTLWQAHNSMQYVRLMRLVRQMFAEAVCVLLRVPASQAGGDGVRGIPAALHDTYIVQHSPTS